MRIDYGKWLGNIDWNYIITIRRNYKWSRKGIRRTIDKIGKNINSIDNINNIFLIGEHDLDDTTNYHLHIILSIKQVDDVTVIDFIESNFNKKDNKHIEDVLCNKSVGIYLSKFIDRDLEYDYYTNRYINEE